jgi:Tetratricopeptide repeat
VPTGTGPWPPLPRGPAAPATKPPGDWPPLSPTTGRDPADWPLWNALLPHIDALTGHAPPGTDTAVTARLLNQTGLFLNDQGAPARAITYHQRAHTARVRVLGDDHPDTLTSRNNLASAYL